MKNIAKRIAILMVIFILALAGYFAMSFFKKDENGIAYTSIEDANLPVAYVEMYGKEMNRIYGFVEANERGAGRSDLAVLPQDRRLTVGFDDVYSRVKGIRYEIRSLDGERLVERTELTEWNQEENGVKAVLPIQNLLTDGEEYRMTLVISTENHPAVYYYMRIVWTETSYIEDMLQLAEEFSEKTFDYDAARDLTTYLETDENADNSSLGKVTLKNSFTQLTWRGMEMERVGDISVHLREMQGILGVVELDYVAARMEDGKAEEYYDVSECFTMKWGTQRIYMMDYERRVNVIFSGEEDLYSDKRIMVGISDGEDLQAVSDPSGKYKAFVANKTLWSLDMDKGGSTKVFAFRKSEEDLRTSFRSHGVKILSVSEAGDIDFLVYGYMNRGNHEGTTGIALYRYMSGDNTLTERLYLPAKEDYWELREDVNRLSYLSGQTLYIMMDHAVYGVDLLGKEYMVVADGLTEENFAVSADGARIAWQEGDDIYSAKKLNVMDLQAGKKDEIQPEGDSVVRLVGFVGSDLVYGLAHDGEYLTSDGRVIGLPLYAVEIVGCSMERETRYEKEGVYLGEVSIQDSRVHLSRLRRVGDVYEEIEEDTLVCNEEVETDPLAGIGYLADNEQGRRYFIQLDTAGGKERGRRLHVPKGAVAEENNVISLQPNRDLDKTIYYAYSGGRMRGSYAGFSRAVQAAYEGMGLVTDKTGRIYWTRASRSDARTVRELQSEAVQAERYLQEMAEGRDSSADGTSFLDGRGLTLSQVLYFVFCGKPVAAYLGDGSHCLIYGYDQYNVSILWYPGTEQAYTDKMGLNDAAAYFESHGGNDFICFLPGKAS